MKVDFVLTPILYGQSTCEIALILPRIAATENFSTSSLLNVKANRLRAQKNIVSQTKIYLFHHTSGVVCYGNDDISGGFTPFHYCLCVQMYDKFYGRNYMCWPPRIVKHPPRQFRYIDIEITK